MITKSSFFLFFVFCISFLLPTVIWAQEVKFQSSKASPAFENEINRQFHKAELFQATGTLLNAEKQKSTFNQALKMSFGDQYQWEFELEPYDLFAENAIIRELSEDGEIFHPVPRNVSFRGHVKGAPDKKVILNINEEHVFGFIDHGEKRTYISVASKYIKNAPADLYLVFDRKDQKSDNEGTCGGDHHLESIPDNQDHHQGTGRSMVGDCYDVELAVACDYLMYQDQGATVQACVNHVLDVMADVGTNYELNGTTNFDDGIVYKIVEQAVATCDLCDPWTNSTAPGDLLSDFYLWAFDGFINAHDMGSLWTNRDFDGTTVGLAYTSNGLLCGGSAYHVLQDYTNNADELRVLTAHEMGHNWGAPHADAGTIMAPTVNNTNTWAASTKSSISAQIASQGPSCLTIACPSMRCDSLVNVQISNITSTGFDISWTATTESLYRLRVRDEENFSIIHTTNPTSSTTMTINPTGWEICKYYAVIVENDCGSGDYGAASTVMISSPLDQGCAEFTVDKTIDWGSGTFLFTDESINATSWSWDFGDGNTSTTKNPSHTYAAAGIYTVELSVNSGANTKVKTDYIQVLPDKSLPYTLGDGGDMNANDFGTESKTLERVSLFEKGIPSNYFTNSTNCWVTDLDADIISEDNESWLYSPRFDFTNTEDLILSFDLGMETFYSNAPYGLQVHYSLNDGSTWTRLGSDADVGWYNKGPSSPQTLSVFVFPDQMGWLFTNQSINYSYDVSALAGNSSVIFAFVFNVASGFSLNGYLAGAMIDNMEISATILPVELIAFNGKLIGEKIELEWKTATETNNDYFLIEKSVDGLNFEVLGTVQGAGSTFLPQQYQLLDSNPVPGVNYYRLTQFDYDGNFEIFNRIVAVEYLLDQTIFVQPNPVKGDLIQLIYNQQIAGEMLVDIFNVNGQLMQQLNVETLAENNVFDLNISNLAKGVYIIRTSQDNNIHSLRFVKTE